MPTFGRILAIDDNEDALFALRLLLEPLSERVLTLTSTERLVHHVTDFDPHLVLLDMNFSLGAVSGEEGMHCLRQIRKLRPDALVVMMTAYADTDKAVQAIKAGATDFVPKPWTNDKLLFTLQRAMRLHTSETHSRRLEKKVEALATAPEHRVPPLIGSCPPMLRIRQLIDTVGATEAGVLLLGENGTGKDVVARHLHENSLRRDEPFVSIDCGAIPDSLFESELFGHEKGAFTDARGEKKGRLELAHGGTLFLDEIGNLSPAAQIKLLTALEQRRIVRVGGTRELHIDVRLVCATNADLPRLIREGAFRQDLYYRINTVEMHIPPLRERGDDIGLLAEHFLAAAAKKYHKPRLRLSREAHAALGRYTWPGNVRELQHTIERAVVLCGGDVLQPTDFMLYPTTPRPAEEEAEELNLEELERRALRRALEVAGGNLTRAAKLLGITRYTLYRKIEKREL